jgi:nucleoside-diphosphate-sugar epimerase
LDTLIIRPNAVYGKVGKNFNRWDLIPFAFPKAIFDNNQIFLKTHGLQYRNFVSSNTIAKIIHESIKREIVGIINPIGYHNMSIIKFAEFCIDTINLEYGIKSSIEISIPDYSEQEVLYNKLINSQKSSNKLNSELKKNVISIPSSITNTMLGYENITQLSNSVYIIGTTDGYYTFNIDELNFKNIHDFSYTFVYKVSEH